MDIDLELAALLHDSGDSGNDSMVIGIAADGHAGGGMLQRSDGQDFDFYDNRTVLQTTGFSV